MTRKLFNKAAEAALTGAANGNGGAGAPMSDPLAALPWWKALFFERDGDFNPGWLVFSIFCVFILAINVLGFMTVEMHPESWPVIVALLTADVLCMWLATGLVADIARVKLMLPVLAKGVGAIGQVGAMAPRVANIRIDDERDE